MFNNSLDTFIPLFIHISIFFNHIEGIHHILMAMLYKAECQKFKCHDMNIEFFKALPVRG